MKNVSIVITKPCAGVGFSYGVSGEPIDAKEDVAKELIRAGYAITPGEAKKAAASKKQTTTAKTSKETTAK